MECGSLIFYVLGQILVRYRGALPDLFREGHSVVAEGFVRPFDQYPSDLTTGADQHASLTAKAKESGCYFAAIEVLAKHDEVTPSINTSLFGSLSIGNFMSS